MPTGNATKTLTIMYNRIYESIEQSVCNLPRLTITYRWTRLDSDKCKQIACRLVIACKAHIVRHTQNGKNQFCQLQLRGHNTQLLFIRSFWVDEIDFAVPYVSQTIGITNWHKTRLFSSAGRYDSIYSESKAVYEPGRGSVLRKQTAHTQLSVTAKGLIVCMYNCTPSTKVMPFLFLR